METSSTLTVKTQKIPACDLSGVSSLPSIAEVKNIQQKTNFDLQEDDELYVGFGYIDGAFPYLAQNQYTRQLKETDVKTVILENQYLRATFLPGYGGKLHSLFDKEAGRELLFSNPVLQAGNLSVRNAWISGGVEWNCGIIGHNPFTCSSVFTAILHMDDGTPVLRIYEFERIRQAVYQVDFFLPENSRLLFCRMRIVNTRSETIPMYWWSNIAVPGVEHGRVLVDADESYSDRGQTIHRVPVPYYEGVDITYPENTPISADYFWRIPQEKRKYICYVDSQGYGLVQTSTPRLRGRKLFVWGEGRGGKHWQEFLSVPGGGKYVEIQAGLGYTQYECVPMAPKNAWEWMEAYGAVKIDPDVAHGDWKQARNHVNQWLSHQLPEEQLEQLLRDTHSMALRPAEELIETGSGWGALENLLRQTENFPAICPHLDFGDLQEEQQPWKSLLENERFPLADTACAPLSWMLQPEWSSRILKAAEGTDSDNWFTWLQLGVTSYAQRDWETAEKALKKSFEIAPNAWSLYALACLQQLKGDVDHASQTVVKAAALAPEDPTLAQETMRLLLDAQKFDQAIEFYTRLSAALQKKERIRLFYAFACVRSGDYQQAEKVLLEDGGLEVPDVREGETFVTELWLLIEEAKARSTGKEWDMEKATPPFQFEFRAHLQSQPSQDK